MVNVTDKIDENNTKTKDMKFIFPGQKYINKIVFCKKCNLPYHIASKIQFGFYAYKPTAK